MYILDNHSKMSLQRLWFSCCWHLMLFKNAQFNLSYLHYRYNWKAWLLYVPFAQLTNLILVFCVLFFYVIYSFLNLSFELPISASAKHSILMLFSKGWLYTSYISVHSHATIVYVLKQRLNLLLENQQWVRKLVCLFLANSW